MVYCLLYGMEVKQRSVDGIEEMLGDSCLFREGLGAEC